MYRLEDATGRMREGSLSIQLPLTPEKTTCELCDIDFRATGLTGHFDDEPICDACLHERLFIRRP